MNPRRRRHNRHARKRRTWERHVARLMGGTWSNVPTVSVVDPDLVRRAVHRLKKVMFAGPVLPPAPTYEYKIRGYFNPTRGRW